MAVTTNIVLFLLAVAVILFIGFAISCILRIMRTAEEMTLTLQIFNEKLPAIVKNIEEITADVSRTTATMHGQLEDLSLIIKRVKGALFVLAGVEEIIRKRVSMPFVPTLRTALAVSKGVRVFLNHLLGKRQTG